MMLRKLLCGEIVRRCDGKGKVWEFVEILDLRILRD
jgi:hypothetical protein